MNVDLINLAVVLATASALGILARVLKQPTVIAYIITGIALGFFLTPGFGDSEIFHLFSEIGIMFLLFLIGLEINYESVRLVGKTSFIIGIGQIIFTSLFGFLITSLFGFSVLHALYIGVALTFSSTIIIIKLLSEQKAMNSLYGKISVGFLLVQDFVVILILIMLSGIEHGGTFAPLDLVMTTVNGAILFFLMFWISKWIMPAILDKVGRSQELLFLTSLAWCFGVTAAVSMLGFSIEIGGFLAGIALANSSEHYQIAAKIKPLRDFFIVIFFAILGASFGLFEMTGMLPIIIVLSLFVLIGNPLIVITIMSLMGYKKRVSFMCGIVVAQISEFSLVFVALGARLGHVSPEVISLITMVGIITIVTSTYMVEYNHKLYSLLAPYLSIFERKSAKDHELPETASEKPIIIIGADRTGKHVLKSIDKERVLIIDFNPDIIHKLKEEGFDALYGDISNDEIMEAGFLQNAETIVCTSPDFFDNVKLVTDAKKAGFPAKIIVRAETEDDEKYLYGIGADYVMLPYRTIGEYVGEKFLKLISPQGGKEENNNQSTEFAI
jgi:Kef-type K+ transport system membrane component KefB